MGNWESYFIMHRDEEVLCIQKNGMVMIYNEKMLPYDLYLEETSDIDVDVCIQNLDNFYHWCASRVLTLDRQYAKEIMNSIGEKQMTTDKDRAMIALSYHCLSLMDVYWTKTKNDEVRYKDINIYENHLKNAFVDLSLRGKQMTIENSQLIAGDLSTQGLYPKAWIRKDGEFYLLKGGKEEYVKKELLASKICRCFRCNQVEYEPYVYGGENVSISKIITSLKYGIIPMVNFEIYALNHNIDKMKYILELDGYSYYMMNILDYLIGNTDRHWGNWGFLIDNQINEPVRMYDLMDFNGAFNAYDTVDGANCLTTKEKRTQKEAAIEAVKTIGLNQLHSIKKEWFYNEDYYNMFENRFAILKEYDI